MTGASCQHELSTALADRYKHIGDMEDVEEQLVLLKSVIGGSDDSELVLAAEFDISIARRLIYERSGDHADFLAAYGTQRAFVTKPLSTSISKDAVLSELGYTMMCRYQKHRDLEDIKTCITMQRALSAAQPCTFLPRHRLALALSYYYLKTSDISFLHKAAELHRENVTMLGSKHRDRYNLLNGLGNCLGMLYQNTDDTQYFQDSVSSQKAALEALDTRHPVRRRILQLLQRASAAVHQFGRHASS